MAAGNGALDAAPRGAVRVHDDASPSYAEAPDGGAPFHGAGAHDAPSRDVPYGAAGVQAHGVADDDDGTQCASAPGYGADSWPSGPQCRSAASSLAGDAADDDDGALDRTSTG